MLMTGFGHRTGCTARWDCTSSCSSARSHPRTTRSGAGHRHCERRDIEAQVPRALRERRSTSTTSEFCGALTVDATGRITAADARETTEQTKTQRTEAVDIGALAKSFASADRSGKGIGAASPNLIAKGTLGGQPVVVTYGSPRRRGRTVLGAVVPYDKRVAHGRQRSDGVDVRQGHDDRRNAGARRCVSSLWTIPKADGTVQLINNKQHGQWGTDYDPRRISCACR